MSTELDIDTIIESFTKDKLKIEDTIGLFFKNGKPKTVSDKQAPQLMTLYRVVNDIREDIERFQEDLRKAYPKSICHSETVEKRVSKKFPDLLQARDSDYYSSPRLSVFSNVSQQSTNRLSNIDPVDDDQTCLSFSIRHSLVIPTTPDSDINTSQDRVVSRQKSEVSLSADAEQYDPSPKSSNSEMSDTAELYIPSTPGSNEELSKVTSEQHGLSYSGTDNSDFENNFSKQPSFYIPTNSSNELTDDKGNTQTSSYSLSANTDPSEQPDAEWIAARAKTY